MSWRLVLLCVCIVLLPLRGWAFAAMHTPASPDTHGIALHAAAAAAPCHAVALADERATMQEQQAFPGPALSGEAEEVRPAPPAANDCAICDICHGAVAPPLLSLAGFTPMQPGAPPAWTPSANGRLAVHELFRPPRG